MKKLDYEKWCKIDGTEDVMISNFGNVKTEGAKYIRITSVTDTSHLGSGQAPYVTVHFN